MPLVRAVTSRIVNRRVDVYYKRTHYGCHRLVFGGVKDGFVFEGFIGKRGFIDLDQWTADVLDFIDRAKNHPARQQRFEA